MTIKVSEMTAQQKMGNTGAAPSAARNWDFAYTWNSGGTTFCADFMNITDTASAAASLLFDRQVGGVSKFAVGKTGKVTLSIAADTAITIFTSVGIGRHSSIGGLNLFGGTGTTDNQAEVNVGTSKLTLTSSYNIAWTSSSVGAATTSGISQHSAGVVQFNDGTRGNIRGLQGGGAAVASAAALPLPTGNVFHVTGTTGITSITSTNFQAGVMITLIFDGALTVTDGSNLKVAGNFTTTADDTLTLVYDGTNWYEVCRSVN